MLKATRPFSTAPAMALIAGVPGVPGVLRPPVAVGPLLDDEPELLGPGYIYIYTYICIFKCCLRKSKLLCYYVGVAIIIVVYRSKDGW